MIVASGIAATEAARKATASIPIVMVGVADPVGAKLVQSLVRPGGTVTGLASQVTPEIRGKQLQLLREALPRTRQIAILPQRRGGGRGRVEGVRGGRPGPRGGDALRRREGAARSSTPRWPGWAGPPARRCSCPGRRVFFMNRAALVDSALRHRVPAMFTAREFTDAGGLMSYSARLTDQFHRAAEYVGRVLRGTRPGEMPVEQPTSFELVVNLKTATALELTLPPAFLLRADEVLR